MQRSDFRFLDRLRVRWAEVDMQKIVFNGHYFTYFDAALAGYWRAMAMPYHETMERLQGDLYVRKATLEYEGSARYDDLLEIGIRCTRIGTSSLVFTMAVFRGEQRLVHGDLIYVFADPVTQTSRPVPAGLRELLAAHGRGEAALEVHTGSWDALGREAQALRLSVFVQEQRIPAELECDADDAGAVHALARNRFGLALGTGRLLAHASGVARIGRMAVRHDMRGARIGTAVLEALIGVAQARGDHEVLLHAQQSAAGFYTRHGFSLRGEPFVEAGLAHVTMVRRLPGRTHPRVVPASPPAPLAS